MRRKALRYVASLWLAAFLICGGIWYCSDGPETDTVILDMKLNDAAEGTILIVPEPYIFMLDMKLNDAAEGTILIVPDEAFITSLGPGTYECREWVKRD